MEEETNIQRNFQLEKVQLNNVWDINLDIS